MVAIHTKKSRQVKWRFGYNCLTHLPDGWEKDTPFFNIASIYSKKKFNIYKKWICLDADLYLKSGSTLHKFRENKSKEDCKKIQKTSKKRQENREYTDEKQNQTAPKTSKNVNGLLPLLNWLMILVKKYKPLFFNCFKY